MSIEPLFLDEGVEVLRASGELDVTVVPAVLPRVREMVAGTRGVVLDLTAVTFVDSSGLRLVDRLARACAQVGAAFRVVAPPGSAGRRLLELVGMAGDLAVDDLPTALRVVRPS